MFRFTIRDVLWLTVVAALAVGWWLDHRTQTSARSDATTMRQMLERFMGREGYHVHWTDQNAVLTIRRPGEP